MTSFNVRYIIISMDENRQGSAILLAASIIAPLIFLILYYLDDACTYSPNANIEKICQFYVYNNFADTILTFSNRLSNTIMPMLFIPYLIIALVFNILLIRPYLNLTKYQHRLEFLPRNSRLFRVFSGAYLGLGIIFSIISLAATSVIIYMGIIFGVFWIKSSPARPVDMQAVAMNDAAISIGLCFFALVPVLAILPYRCIYKEYDAYLNTYHPKDTKRSFRTGVFLAILLICLDVFLRQFG